MNSIIIEGTHPVFFKTAEEETELLVNGGEKERFYYIWRGKMDRTAADGSPGNVELPPLFRTAPTRHPAAGRPLGRRSQGGLSQMAAT